MRIVAIKEINSYVTCGDDDKAAHTFNVRNSVDGRIRISARVAVNAPAEASWLAIEGSCERDLEKGGETRFVVNIQAPAGSKPGKYSYRLRVFDPENPGEKYTDGEEVYFEVAEKKPATPANEKKKKRWMPYAIAAGVALVILGGIIFFWPEEKWVTVPPLKNLSLVDALGKVNAASLSFNIETGLFGRKVMKKELEGFILDQKPKPRTKVLEKTEVQLWVGVLDTVAINKIIMENNLKRLQNYYHIKIPKSQLNRSLVPEPESK